MLKRKNDRQPPQRLEEECYPNDYWLDEEDGIAMAGIKVDINPIAEERITLAEYMKESELYLDQQEIKKLAVDLDNFSYEYDTYEYKDTVEDREEQVEKITEDILNKKTECLKDWLVEISEESDIDSDVITARSLLSRLENAETLSIFTRQPEQERPEATISFYVAECMEFAICLITATEITCHSHHFIFHFINIPERFFYFCSHFRGDNSTLIKIPGNLVEVAAYLP